MKPQKSTLFVPDVDAILSLPVVFWSPAGSWESLALWWSEWLNELMGLGCGKETIQLLTVNSYPLIHYGSPAKSEQ